MIAKIKVYRAENSIFQYFCLFNEVKYQLTGGTDEYRIYDVEYDDGYLLYLMGKYVNNCSHVNYLYIV